MSLNRKVALFSGLKDQASRVHTIAEHTLQAHQLLGSIYAALDTAEAARAIGGISPEGFQEIRKALDKAIQTVDAAVRVIGPQKDVAFAALQDAADEIQAYQTGMPGPAPTTKGYSH